MKYVTKQILHFCCFLLYITDEETKAQWGYLICSYLFYKNIIYGLILFCVLEKGIFIEIKEAYNKILRL